MHINHGKHSLLRIIKPQNGGLCQHISQIGSSRFDICSNMLHIRPV